MTRQRRGVRIPTLATSALSLLCLLLRVSACTHDAEVVSAQATDAGLLDTFVAPDVESDAPLEGSADSGADVTLPDAALAPCSLGINPTFSAADGGSPVDLTLAELQTLGAGSRAGSFVLSFDSLLDASGVVSPAALDRLASSCSLYAQHEAELALTLALVDRARDARPSALAGDWASSSGVVDALVDGVFSACSSLSYLGFGYQADRYLSQASPTDRAAFAALAVHAMGYARLHASKPARLKVGVVFSLEALLSSSTNEQTMLRDAGDLILASELPLDAMFQAVAPQTAVDGIVALTEATAGDASSPAIALVDVGYPSAGAAGSSLEQQRAFFDALLAMLATHRERFPFVAIDGLFDRDGASCEGDSALYGAPSDPALVAALCSLGLEESAPLVDGGAQRPALASVLAGLSAFSK